MKYSTLFLSFMLLYSNSMNAEILTKKNEASILDFGKTVPIVKNQSLDIKDAISIQKEYFEENNSYQFNLAMVSYYIKHIDNFLGFNTAKEFIFKIPSLNNIYINYVKANNIVSREKYKREYKEEFYRLGNTFDPLFFKDKIYYSESPLGGVETYNLKENKKTMIFKNINYGLPSIHFECYKNGEAIGMYTGSYYKDYKIISPSNVTKTPIILELPREIKNKLTYYKGFTINEKGKKVVLDNLCSLTKKFKNINEGEKFEIFINNRDNRFISFFDIDYKNINKPYLTGKLRKLGLFEIDYADYYHFPFEVYSGETYDNNLDYIIENKVDIKEKDKNYSKMFLESTYSYSIGDYFFKGFDNKKILLTKEGSRMLISYDFKLTEKEVIITFDKIIREGTTDYPLKIRVIKDPEKSSYDLDAYVIESYSPFSYIKKSLNLKKGFYIDWDEIKKMP